MRPLAWLFGLIVRLRRWAYARRWLTVERVGVPVLVIGNITVGGSGKTPLALALIDRLGARGLRVGVVSRGYGGQADRYPLVVSTATPATEAGDEPLLLARTGRAVVAVDPVRPRAARYLVERYGVQVILADDGLQHYALARDAEIAVTDTRRGLGNGWLLPAGPLREPASRLNEVDLSLRHGRDGDFYLVPDQVTAVVGDHARPLSDFEAAEVHAVAGIGDPERFFAMLRDAGLRVIAHPMNDHHRFVRADIDFDDGRPVLMTAKDAVKCSAFADRRHWAVDVQPRLSATGERRIDALLDRLCAGIPPQEITPS
ncbi:tetraacyldisaccharide 4'-kinase [Salinisphaera sp. T31B1]|uniref:tetraacyldisaccharide 4'-kinase n=1 Tax=Salinisphaera sp. T31B1 TaxID=727963 RepID=UPI003342B166